MNSHLEPSRDHTRHEEDPQKHDQVDGGSGGVHTGQNEEHHGEKPSMMKRVRAKARKIRESIKHVGHGNDHEVVDDDDDDDDEMDTDSEKHATHTSQSVVPGKEGVARQHEPKVEGRTAAEGASVASKPGDYQTFDPTTTKYTPGQDETTLGWSRTDTGTPKESEEQPYEPKSTPAFATHLGGGHTTGDSEIGKEGGHVKLGGRAGGSLGGVEENYQAPKGVWGHHSPANYQAKVADPTSLGYDSTADQGVMPEGHGSKLGERTEMEGITNVRMNKPEGDDQTFDTNPTSYAPGQEATLRADEASNASKDTPFAAHSGYDSTADQGVMPEGHGSKLGERTAMGGITNVPMNKPQGDHQTFDTNPASYAHGQEETLRAEEAFSASKDSPFAAHSGGEEIGVTPVLHHLDRMNIHGEPQKKQYVTNNQEESMFEPENSPRDKRLSSGSHDQVFPKPVTFETRSSLETPESGSHHGLGDEGWHNNPEQKQDSYAEMASSADAMMADKAKQATSSVTPKQGYGGSSDKQSSAVQGLHQEHSEPGGNAEKISIATAVVADKAVQAKDVVATKLGYGGISNHQSSAVPGLHEKHSEPGGNAEKLSIATAIVADKAVQAKDTAATKLGYGGTHEAGLTTMPTDTSDATDKRVSMKEYLVEKLKPGEDDKALSPVITESLPLHKRKEDVSKIGEEEEGKKVPIKGRVTDSEEVATRLGKSENTSYDEAGSGLSSPRKGVMERIMHAATSWYNKTDVSPAEDIKEGKEGSSSIITSVDDGADGQNEITKD